MYIMGALSLVPLLLYMLVVPPSFCKIIAWGQAQYNMYIALLVVTVDQTHQLAVPAQWVIGPEGASPAAFPVEQRPQAGRLSRSSHVLRL